MNREQFSKRFDDAIKLMLAHTKMVCFNELSPDYKFILLPNESKTPVVLDDEEIAYAKTLKNLNLKPQSHDEVLDLIQQGEKFPLWINMSVYRSGANETLIEMLCARRLRKPENMPNSVDKYPPFHVWVAMPTKKDKIISSSKFDVNWRSDAENKKGLFNKIVGYFSNS